MHEVLVNRLGGLSLPRKSVVRLTDRPDMTLDVYRGRKTTMQQCNLIVLALHIEDCFSRCSLIRQRKLQTNFYLQKMPKVGHLSIGLFSAAAAKMT